MGMMGRGLGIHLEQHRVRYLRERMGTWGMFGESWVLLLA
jgi:hypothetical protein